LLEDTVEKHFVKRIKEVFPGVEVRKFEARRNDPDRIVFLPEGRTVLVELKRPGKDLRQGQIRAKKRFEKLGHSVYKASTRKEVDDLINGLISSAPYKTR